MVAAADENDGGAPEAANAPSPAKPDEASKKKERVCNRGRVEDGIEDGLCGSFGCVLPNLHKGLCLFPVEGGRRGRH